MVAVAESPKKDSPYTSARVPILLKRKVRNLYLFEDATHERIAQETGITIQASQKMVQREGWVQQRKAREAKLVQKSDARMSCIDDEIVEAIASSSEQHALRGLQKVGESLERSDEMAAKDFQSYTAGVKNLVGVVKTLRDPVESVAAGPLTMNLFFSSPVAPASEPKTVIPLEPS